MTSTQIATIGNLISVGAVLIISLLTASRYHRWFFRYWTLGYCSFVVLLVSDTSVLYTARTIGISLVEVIAGALCAFFFLLTGMRFRFRNLMKCA